MHVDPRAKKQVSPLSELLIKNYELRIIFGGFDNKTKNLSDFIRSP